MRPLTLLTLLAACKPEPGAADPDLPTVIASSPADGAVDVDVDASVRISFDRAIDPALLDADHVVIVPDVPGALRWDEPSLTATFDPTGPLAVHTPYTVTLTPDLAVATTLRFSTGGPPEVAPPDATVAFDGDRVTVSVDGDALRTYTLASTHPQRDGGPSTRTFTEPDGQPRLRSGDVLFDALFALAVHEAGEASVDQIHDGGFANGAGTPCRCYETGERWTYVWTRDTSYAAWLGLWLLDPARARDSLLFKLSAPKGGGGEQIVQDTGSGGSWPVSTDRVVWALAAREVEKALPDPARVAFRERAFAALANTLEHDRDRVWDPADGLYRGEQSFLDWREQSYPPWTAANVTPIAESRSLSTNAAHHALLTTAAAWAREAGDPRAAT
ncbi:MAG TPA: Ig-like domain-containing protein, partial [Myxococcota bacterium]|nr:Ig-like domain-containing protein [Myxococcota bacterium]